MLDTILANDFVGYFTALLVFLITLLMCSRHFKKYGFLQGIFSTLCIPMLIHGLGQLLAYMFKENTSLVILLERSVLSLDGLKQVYILLLEKTGIEWFTQGIGLYVPFIVIFFMLSMLLVPSNTITIS